VGVKDNRGSPYPPPPDGYLADTATPADSVPPTEYPAGWTNRPQTAAAIAEAERVQQQVADLTSGVKTDPDTAPTGYPAGWTTASRGRDN
jgi:hypothetical protein